MDSYEGTKIELGDVQRTLFLPLWGRAVESLKKKPLLVDREAVRIIQNVHFDFATLARKMKRTTRLAWIVRCKYMDRAVTQFLSAHPRATVVNVGCGMDTTFERVDNRTVTWYDLDLPDVIELRRRFIREGPRRHFIADSFLSTSWRGSIPTEGGVMMLAAGVFYYFEEDQIRGFFREIAETFPGSEIVFDVASPLGVRVANKAVIAASGLTEKSYLLWGLSDLKSIAGWDGRISILEASPLFNKRKKGIKFSYRPGLVISDFLKIQSLVHLRFRGG